jgi:cytochrome c
MFTKALVTAFALVSSAGMAVASDVAAGAASFKKCVPCHMIGEGATNKVGPYLNGIEGRKTGYIPGFGYTDANRSSGIVWNKTSFKEYIADPRSKIPGTKMVFAGVKDDKEQDDLWAYLIQFGPAGEKR